jgi:hypothetical protein
MAAQKAKRGPEPVNPSLSRHTVMYLRKLKRTGLHGNSLGAVARTLIQDQIKALIREGSLAMEFFEDDDSEEGGETSG